MDVLYIIKTVKHNCNVSDARYWGYYSICGMLMRMRELYRHEHGLLAWDALRQDDVLTWVEQRESLWETLQDEQFKPITILSKQYDPFDIDEINAALSKQEGSFIYGAGYGHYHKPSFFISSVRSKTIYDGYTVYYLEKELCRDLSSSTAMFQGRSIYIRLEPLAGFLYNRFLELSGKKLDDYLRETLNNYGLEFPFIVKDALFSAKFAKLTDRAARLLTLHELGEAFSSSEDKRLPDEWLNILADSKDRFVELYLRGVKDVLSDTSLYGP
ncbi:hypothetical protein MCHI_002374, partial [Candidatus Magnetoovum chiemensis]